MTVPIPIFNDNVLIIYFTLIILKFTKQIVCI